MIATLKFDLNDESDKMEFDYAVNAYKAFRVLRDLDDTLRSSIKYNADHYNDEQLDILIKLREQLHDLKLQNDLTLE